MKKTYSIIKTITIIFMIALMNQSCNHKDTEKNTSYFEEDSITENIDSTFYEDEIIHTGLCYFNFDQIPDLILFFDSIKTQYGIQCFYEEERQYIETELDKCIKQIEAYRKGKAKYYPAERIRTCLNSLGQNAAVIYNHSCFTNLGYSEWFLMCAAFYSPDITYLVDMQSPNHHIGVLNFGQTYTWNPWWSYVLCKKEKGYEVKCLKDFSKIDGIFELYDNNKIYYLLSNNMNAIEFEQYLYFEKGNNNIIEVATCPDTPYISDLTFETYYFNKDKLEWYFCNWDNNHKERIAVTTKPAMTLKLLGEKSFFSIENE